MGLNEGEEEILRGGVVDASDPHTKVRLEHELSALREGGLSGGALYRVINDLAEAGLLKARHAIERYLKDPDPFARHTALAVLILLWALPDHRSTAEDFLLHDVDEDNRGLGAACVGHLAAGTQDPSVLKVLCRVVRNESEQAHVRIAAYNAILSVMSVPRQEWLPVMTPEDSLGKIDWSFVRSIEESLL